MKPLITKRNCIQGAIIFTLGDSCAALLTGEFQISRLISMMLLGGTLYAVEISWYFAWIECRFERQGFVKG